VRGSPLNEEAFDRVNIMEAKQVVILTPSTAVTTTSNAEETAEEALKSEEMGFFNDDENLRDAKTIFIYNIIKKKNKKVTVLTELITEENISYMMEDPALYSLQNNFGFD
jgi:deoxyhypusine synthase